MATPTQLFDTAALARNRARAGETFLQERAADGVEERLAEVNRSFTAPAVVTPFPAVWRDRLPGARLVVPGDVLDIEVGAHDLVIHALALHWANDPVGQLVQARRALRPDGLLIATLFGGRTLHELRAALAEAEVALTGGLSPRVAPMAEIRDLGGLLQRAGLALPVADTETATVRYAALTALLHDLRRMGEGNAITGRDRRTPPRDLFARADRIYRDAFADGDGRLPATFEIVTLTGWAPGPGQPKALRPGSANRRLAEALGTTETALPDGETG